MSLSRNDRIVECANCKRTVKWRSREWTKSWSVVWVGGVNESFDSCSIECSTKIVMVHQQAGVVMKIGEVTESRLGIYEVYEVDFDSPGCVHAGCQSSAIPESGSSRRCFEHWEYLRRECKFVRTMFEKRRGDYRNRRS